MKLVIVLLALLLLVWLVTGSVRRRAKEARRENPAAPEARANSTVEGMVACAHCGVHLPASLSLSGKGHSYCSAAHRDGGPRAP
ncbi:MAG: PP0621 family protein [Pseudomonadota bacterium]